MKSERVATPLFQRLRVGILGLAVARSTSASCLRHALVMRQRFDLAHVQALLDDALGAQPRIGLADQRARMAGRQFAGAI